MLTLDNIFGFISFSHFPSYETIRATYLALFVNLIGSIVITMCKRKEDAKKKVSWRLEKRGTFLKSTLDLRKKQAEVEYPQLSEQHDETKF